MRGWILSVALCLVAMAWACPARAQLFTFGDYDLSLTESLFVDFHQSELTSDANGTRDFNFMLFRNRLNIALTSSWLEAGIRMDTAWFLAVTDGGTLAQDEEASDWHDIFDRKYDNDFDFTNNRGYLPEKIYLSVRKRNFSLELGDFYATLGKGIALSIKKVDELSTDTTLRGAKATYRDRVVSFTALGGFSNIVNVGDLIMERFDDPNDLIVGVEMKVRPISWLEAALHGSLIKDNENYDRVATTGDYQRDQLAVLGGAISIPDVGGFLSFNAEYDYMTNEVVRFFHDSESGKITYPGESDTGHAVYSMLNAHWNVLHFLGEFKYYKGFHDNGVVGKEVIATDNQTTDLIYYGALPPLEDPGLFLRPDLYDQVGFRLRLDGEIPATNSILFASYHHTEGLDEPDFGDIDTQSYVHHVIGGVEQRVDSLSIVGKVSGGYRQDKYELKHHRTMWHLDAEVHFPIFGPHGMEVLGRYESYSPESDVEDPFSIAKSTLTYTFAPWVTTSFNYEFSDQPPIKDDKKHFLSGEVVVRFMQASYLKLMYGSTRGGLRCAGGMCRYFPQFEGFKGEVTVRF